MACFKVMDGLVRWANSMRDVESKVKKLFS